MTEADSRPPYDAYATIAGAFFGGLATVAALSRRAPPSSPLEFAALAAATFKVSRTLSRERVGSFVRQPFVEGDADTGEDEQPAGTGFPAGDRRARHLPAMPRHLERSGAYLERDAVAPVRASAHLVARRLRGKRLLAGRLRGTVCEGERAGRRGSVARRARNAAIAAPVIVTV